MWFLGRAVVLVGEEDHSQRRVFAYEPRELFQAPVEAVWQQTREFFVRRRPAEIERAERDPKHRMALVFRWYLGQASRWAIDGEAGRKLDYQIWCGPAIGAFNAWSAGSFLARTEGRTVELTD